jgi:hypothetical protein
LIDALEEDAARNLITEVVAEEHRKGDLARNIVEASRLLRNDFIERANAGNRLTRVAVADRCPNHRGAATCHDEREERPPFIVLRERQVKRRIRRLLDRSIFDDEISALGETKPSHLIEKRLVNRLTQGNFAIGSYIANAGYFVDFIRASGKRPCRNHATKKRHEFSYLHGMPRGLGNVVLVNPRRISE